MSQVIHDSRVHEAVDVTVTDCPYCNQLRCTDWLTCPGYLRDMMTRLEQTEAQANADQPRRTELRHSPARHRGRSAVGRRWPC